LQKRFYCLQIDAMKAVAKASHNRSISELKEVMRELTEAAKMLSLNRVEFFFGMRSTVGTCCARDSTATSFDALLTRIASLYECRKCNKQPSFVTTQRQTSHAVEVVIDHAMNSAEIW